jgi:hypothetical protein
LKRIENHWENIAAAVVRAAHTDERAHHYRLLDDESLRQRARDLVTDLRQWLAAGEDGATAERYRTLGETRHQQGVALSEIIAATQLIERKITDYIQAENAAQNAVDLYTELEMLRVLHRYFQVVQLSVVEGFEKSAARSRASRIQKAS